MKDAARRLVGLVLLLILVFAPAVVAYRLPAGQPWDTIEWSIVCLYVVVFGYAAYRTFRHREHRPG